jgi:predicted nucleic acid-binding Zn ribbon protein
VAVRKCEQCDASVAADEQFCPNCGAFMDPLSHESHGNVISVSSSGFETFQLREPPEDPKRRPERGSSDAPNSVHCPSCGAANPPTNRHCEECGARLSQAPLPTAPRPAVQATAGVRAALAISGLLFGVVIVALLFNVIGGDDPSTTTTVASTSTTAPVAQENAPIPVINESCSVEPISSFVCANLTSGSEDSYQVNWEELQAEEGVMTIRLTFDQPMIIQQILWRNLTDPVRFQQNYRPRGLIIRASDAVSDIAQELEDTPGEQVITHAAVGANWIEFVIQSAYVATVTEDNVFKDMAIDEITIIGRPQSAATNTTATTSTTAP